MHNLKRGFRNVWRSKVRTAIVALLVGLALSMGVTMMAINGAVADQLAEIEMSVGTELEIRPLGSFGGFGRGEPLHMDVLDRVWEIPNIIEVAPVIVYQSMPRMSLFGGRDAIEAAIRQRMAVMGIVPGQPLRLIGGGTAELVGGRVFSAEDDGQAVAILGVDYAQQNELTLGDTLIIDETEYEVIGLAQGEHRFANSTVFLTFATAQEAFELHGQMSQAYIVVDNLSRVDTVLVGLRDLVGDDADVFSQSEATLGRVNQAMDMVRGTTSVGLWLAFVVGGMVIFFTMLLTVRERQREIGVLKAIGSGSGDLLVGFAWESVVLSAVGALVGIIIFATIGQYLASSLMANIVTQPSVPAGIDGRFIEGMRGMGGGRGVFSGRDGIAGFSVQGGNIVSQLGEVSVNLSLSLFTRLLGTALGLGLLGGLFPALYALRLRPAEVLRHE